MIGAGKCYFYKVVARYLDPECFSPMAKVKYSDEFFVRACNSMNLEENASGRLVIYPNPTKDLVKLSMSGSQLSEVKIYSMMGMLIGKL